MNDDSLEATIERQLSARAPGAVVGLGETLRARFGAQAQAVLFYGSCRRANDVSGGIVDLYVLVDDYRAAYAARWPALANRLLAPNVYYLEIPFEGGTARAKYAVISLAHFERGTAHWFHPYLWGRFAQPSGLLFAADAAVRHRVVDAVAAALTTFAARTLPRLPAEFDDETFWTQGLRLTYAAELRSEAPAKMRALYAGAAVELGSLSGALARLQGWPVASASASASASSYRNPSGRAARAASACGWALRRAQGKVLSVLRLLKASYTFDGGLQYLSWKIERHSGVKIVITPFMRRFPRLGGIGALWRTWWRGGVR